MFADDIAAEPRPAAATRPARQGRHVARPADRGRRSCITSRCSSGCTPSPSRSPSRRGCRSASSSSGCGCSCRSSPGSSCCPRRSASSRPATSSSRSAPGSATLSGSPAQGLTSARAHRAAGGDVDLVRRAAHAHDAVDAAARRAAGVVRAPDVRPRTRDGVSLRVPPARLGHRHVHGPKGSHRAAPRRRPLRPGIRRCHRRRAVRQDPRAVRGGPSWRWSSRGYTGEARTLSTSRVEAIDVAWIVGVRGRWPSSRARRRSCDRS